MIFYLIHFILNCRISHPFRAKLLFWAEFCQKMPFFTLHVRCSFVCERIFKIFFYKPSHDIPLSFGICHTSLLRHVLAWLRHNRHQFVLGQLFYIIGDLWKFPRHTVQCSRFEWIATCGSTDSFQQFIIQTLWNVEKC